MQSLSLRLKNDGSLEYSFALMSIRINANSGEYSISTPERVCFTDSMTISTLIEVCIFFIQDINHVVWNERAAIPDSKSSQCDIGCILEMEAKATLWGACNQTAILLTSYCHIGQILKDNKAIFVICSKFHFFHNNEKVDF